MLGGVGVADGVGQDGRDGKAVGERQGVRGETDRARAGAGQAPAHDLQPQSVAGDLPPGGEEPFGDVWAAGGEGAQGLRCGTEQHRQAIARMLGEHLPRRCGWLALGEGFVVRAGHHPAQPRPPARILGQERGPEGGLRDMGAAAYRGSVAYLGRWDMGGDAEVHSEYRLYSGSCGGLREAHRAGDHVAVGQRHRPDLAFGGSGDDVARVGGAVAGRKPTADV